MFLELIATIVAGIAAAGIMMVITRASGGRLPKWLTPVAAGAAMIAATISNEYGWYGRTSKSLPDEFMIVDTVESKALYRPLDLRASLCRPVRRARRAIGAAPRRGPRDAYGRYVFLRSLGPGEQTKRDCRLRRPAPRRRHRRRDPERRWLRHWRGLAPPCRWMIRLSRPCAR